MSDDKVYFTGRVITRRQRWLQIPAQDFMTHAEAMQSIVEQYASHFILRFAQQNITEIFDGTLELTSDRKFYLSDSMSGIVRWDALTGGYIHVLNRDVTPIGLLVRVDIFVNDEVKALFEASGAVLEFAEMQADNFGLDTRAVSTQD